MHRLTVYYNTITFHKMNCLESFQIYPKFYTIFDCHLFFLAKGNAEY